MLVEKIVIWNQVRILNSPAAVMTEFLRMVFLEKAGH